MPPGQLRNPRARSASLTATAARQHGVFTVAQAQAAGYSPGALKYRIESGTWVAVDYGVYRAAGTPVSWHGRLIAACLAGPAVASHRSAAALWNLAGYSRSVVEVTALRHRRRYANDVTWHESVLLGSRDTTEVDSIPVTDPTRTVIDLSTVATDAQLLEALDDALRRKLTSVMGLTMRLEQMGSRRNGSARLRRLLSRRGDRSPVPESVLESRFEVLIMASRLPEPVRQLEVLDPSGSAVARVDFGYPEARLAIEVDGLRYHAGPDSWRRDLARQNRIVALGWRVLRFTAADIELRPRDVVAAIRRALAATSVSEA